MLRAIYMALQAPLFLMPESWQTWQAIILIGIAAMAYLVLLTGGIDLSSARPGSGALIAAMQCANWGFRAVGFVCRGCLVAMG